MKSQTLKVITLRRTRYSDRSAIITGLSAERGRVSLLVADGSGRGAVRARALTMVPSIIECVVSGRTGRDILAASSLRPVLPLVSLHSNPLKQMVAMFMAEVTEHAIRDASAPDPRLSEFIELSLASLDMLEKDAAIANFHLYFLYHLASVLGVEPDLSTYRPGSWFDMNDGIFRLTMPAHSRTLPPDQCRMIMMLSRLRLETLSRLRLTRAERNAAVETMLRYLTLHSVVNAASLRSLDVLRSLS